jgi:hypothetical protein
MFENRRQNRSAVSGRRALAAPFMFVDQIALRALKEEHPDLPLAAPLDVQVLRQMVGRVEPEVEALECESVDLSQSFLCLSPRPV